MPAARVDILAAYDWYAERNPSIAEPFQAHLDTTVRRIAEQPERYQLVHWQLRRALLSRFPFGVFFQVLPGLVQIVGVIHTSRNPALWRGRSE